MIDLFPHQLKRICIFLSKERADGISRVFTVSLMIRRHITKNLNERCAFASCNRALSADQPLPIPVDSIRSSGSQAQPGREALSRYAEDLGFGRRSYPHGSDDSDNIISAL